MAQHMVMKSTVESCDRNRTSALSATSFGLMQNIVFSKIFIITAQYYRVQIIIAKLISKIIKWFLLKCE